jgi:S1-C subfamily serine protease
MFLVILLSAITQSVQSQNVISSGSGSMNYKTAPTKPVLTAEQIAQRFLPGVALIICDDGKGNYSQGSGFFIAPGMILTNAHVVKGMVRGVVMAGGQQKKNLINAVAYFNSENTDLALLVSDEAKSVKTPDLPLAKPNDLRIGETIYVLSNPEGLVGTISQGIVSSGIRQINKKDLLQITAPISSGSSGGAVMNSRGEVIGIATSSLQGGQNLNFAVPAARIGQFLDEFMTLPSPPEYVHVSNFPKSWIAPKSFLNISKEKPELSLEENSRLLAESIMNLKGMLSNNPIRYKNVLFNACQISFDELSYGPKDGELYRVSSYTANLRFVDRVLNPADSYPHLSIFFKNKISVKDYYYKDGELTLSPYTMDEIFNGGNYALSIFTSERKESESLKTIFDNLIKICKQDAE